MIKVLWLAPVPYVSDGSVHPAPWISTLANSLSTEGNCHITILNFHSRLKQEVELHQQKGIDFIYLKTPVPKVDFLTLYKIRTKIIERYILKRINDFDLIHIHGTEHQYESATINIPLAKVVSMQGIMNLYIKKLPTIFSYTYLSWKMASFYEKQNIKRVNNFMCRTNFDTSFVRDKNKNATIFNNWEMIREEFFQDHFSEKKEYLLFSGGTNSIKGISEMLLAFNRVKLMFPLKLKILGNVDVEQIKKIIKKNKLTEIKEGDIEMLGFQSVEGIVKAFKSSYCLVHPSHIDNSPNTICEAQISGLPVIATNVGGVSSLIKHNETGLLVGLNVDSITDGIIRLIKDDRLRDDISHNSRAFARKRHDKKVILNKTLNIYDKLLNAAK